MGMLQRDLGLAGEQFAADFLAEQGLEIVARNWRFPGGEIDMIVSDKEFLRFVEVKTRKSNAKGQAAAAVGLSKQKTIIRGAQRWIKKNVSREYRVRFDVIAIHWTSAGPDARWIKGAFGA